MARILMKLIKSYDGEEWENTYAIITDGNDSDQFSSPAHLTAAVGVGQFLSAEATNPGDAEFNPDDTIVQAIIGYERSLTAGLVRYERVYLSDGVNNPINSQFWTKDLDFFGLWTAGATQDAVAPGGITLYIARQTGLMSARAGRLFLRMALLDSEVSPIGRGLLDWQNTAARNAVLARESGARAQSNIEAFFSPGGLVPTGAELLGIPSYAAAGSGNAGDMIGVAPISQFVMKRPTMRQVKRGRRRPA